MRYNIKEPKEVREILSQVESTLAFDFWDNITPQGELLNFLEILHGESEFRKGRIYIVHFENGLFKWQYNYSYDQLKENIGEFVGKKDIYITPNSFTFKNKSISRDSSHLWQVRSLYVDLDTEKIYREPIEVYGELLKLIDNEEIPEPSLIVFSGRGLHLYWRIKDITSELIPYWSSLQQKLIDKLSCYGSDNAVKDVARILRLPCTINSRNGATSEVWYSNPSKLYTLQEIEEKYFPKTKKPKTKKKSRADKDGVIDFSKVKLTQLTLCQKRVKDLKTLQELRKGHFYKQRNNLIFIYCYHLAQITHEYMELYKAAYEFNRGFDKPLSIAEVNRVVKHSLKYKGNGTKLKYTNVGIIERFDIEPKEIEQLETIISKEEKQRRNTISKREKRRGEDGLTDKQREREQKRNKAIELAAQGFTHKDIAKHLNVSSRTIRNLLK